MSTIPHTKAYSTAMHTMVLLFGIGAWVAINGVWVELPVLVNSLPENWSLPSFLVALSQCANIGPLVVALMQIFLPKYYYQNVLIYIMMFMGTASCLLLCFFWDKTAVIGGAEHSVALFTLFLVLAFVDCTSSLTFLPFISRFQGLLVTTYFIGEGLSGFLPSIVALAQGASESYCVNDSFTNETTNSTTYHIETRYKSPRFSVEWFFGFLFIMMFCCALSFFLLNHSKVARSFRVSDQDQASYTPASSTSTELSDVAKCSGTGFYTHGRRPSVHEDGTVSTSPLNPTKDTRKTLGCKQYVYFYIIVVWIACISNGIMPSVISYSSLPYGQLPYHFAATLGAMANPVACFIAVFYPVKSHLVIGVFTISTTVFASYLMVLAIQSPCPLLVNSGGGAALMVLSQIFFVLTTSYAKVSIGQILRARGSKNSLVWYGAFTQLGSLIGACVMFPLVNVYYFFISGDPCVTKC